MLTSIPPISNAATWKDTLEVTEDGVAWWTFATPATWPDAITLKLRDQKTDAIVLEGSLSGGDITITADGQAEFIFSATTMNGIEPKTYDVGCLITFDDEVTEVILGSITVLKGL